MIIKLDVSERRRMDSNPRGHWVLDRGLAFLKKEKRGINGGFSGFSDYSTVSTMTSQGGSTGQDWSDTTRMHERCSKDWRDYAVWKQS